MGAELDIALKSATATWTRVSKAEQQAELEARFGELVQRQSRFVFRVAHAVVRNADDAEDIAQETFLKLLKNRSWLTMQDERAFLARTAWRLAVSRRRRLPAEGFFESEPGPTPEAVAIEGQRARRVQTLIEALPEKLRGPLVLSAFEELTTAQIALVLDEPEGTVRRRVSEARALLRQKLERMEDHVRRT